LFGTLGWECAAVAKPLPELELLLELPLELELLDELDEAPLLPLELDPLDDPLLLPEPPSTSMG
jgi:hypothetical protein